MSKYTTQVRFICENLSGLSESVGGARVSEIIEQARTKIFDFDYPIFDEKYRSVLETKILRHYYTREIGLESVGLWKLNLETKLIEIMPFFNQLYKSELLEFQPFNDVNLTRVHKGKFDKDEKADYRGTNVSEENGSTNSTQDYRYSDTPQGAIDNLKADKYLTNASVQNVGTLVDNSSTTNNEFTQTNVAKNIDEYTETLIGKQGATNYSDLLIKFRKTFLNIDMEVIDALSDLFLNLW